MPGLAVDSGVGTTVTFGTSGFTANVESIRWNGIARNAIPTFHLGTAAPGANKFGNKTFIPSRLSDPGELQMSVHFNPQTNPPIDGLAETVTITFPKAPADSTPAIWSATGFVTAYDLTDEMEAAMMANMTVKISGNVTMVDAT